MNMGRFSVYQIFGVNYFNVHMLIYLKAVNDKKFAWNILK